MPDNDGKKLRTKFGDNQVIGSERMAHELQKMFGNKFTHSTNREGHSDFYMKLSRKQKQNLDDAMHFDPKFCDKVFHKGHQGDINYKPSMNGLNPTLWIENVEHFTSADLKELQKRAPLITTLLDKGLDAAKEQAAQMGLYSGTVAPSPSGTTPTGLGPRAQF